MAGRREGGCFLKNILFFCRDRLSKRETKREEIDDQLPEQEECSSKPAGPSGETCVSVSRITCSQRCAAIDPPPPEAQTPRA